MSEKRDKMIAVAQRAAQEATLNERARCLWCAELVVRELRVKLDKKILRSATEEQLAKVKLQIAEAVVVELRRAIVSGARPVSATGQRASAADFSTRCRFCDREFDDPRGHDKEVDHVDHCGG
jgi:hypothetical protein